MRINLGPFVRIRETVVGSPILGSVNFWRIRTLIPRGAAILCPQAPRHATLSWEFSQLKRVHLIADREWLCLIEYQTKPHHPPRSRWQHSSFTLQTKTLVTEPPRFQSHWAVAVVMEHLHPIMRAHGIFLRMCMYDMMKRCVYARAAEDGHVLLLSWAELWAK